MSMEIEKPQIRSYNLMLMRTWLASIRYILMSILEYVYKNQKKINGTLLRISHSSNSERSFIFDTLVHFFIAFL